MTGHPKRQRIVELVESSPGITISELCRELGCKWGTVQYHLYMVERARLVHRVGAGRSRHLFPLQVADAEAGRVASLLQGRAKELVEAVLREPGIGQRLLTQRITISRKVLRGQVRNLLAHGLIDEKRDGRYRRYYPTSVLRTLLGVFAMARDKPTSSP